MTAKRIITCLLFGVLVLNFLAYLSYSGLMRSNKRGVHSQKVEIKSRHKSLTSNKARISHSLAGITQSPNQFTSLWNVISTIKDYSSFSGASEAFQPYTAFPSDLVVFKKWQEASHNRSHRLYIFSAWLDRRGLDDSDGDSIVRVVVISSAFRDIEKFLFCTYFNEHDDESGVSLKARSSVAVGPRVNLGEWPMQGYVIVCPIVDKEILSRISLHFGEHDKAGGVRSAARIMTQGDSHGERVRELTACVTSNSITDRDTTAVDSMDEYRALEWLVMQRILGVEHITVYVNQDNPRQTKIMSTLMSYRHVNPKSLSIRSYNYITTQSTKEVHDLHSSSIASDCFYSYLGTSKRVLILRIEEFLIPKMKTKLPSLLKRLENEITNANSIVPNFVFRVQYFFPNFLPRFDVTPYSIALRYVLKSRRLRGDSNRKTSSLRSVISTSTCAAIEFSRCKTAGNDSVAGSFRMIPENVASVHNYESCDDEIFDCTIALSSSIVDESIRKFEKVLVKRLRKNIMLFFNHNL